MSGAMIKNENCIAKLLAVIRVSIIDKKYAKKKIFLWNTNIPFRIGIILII
jgi:hypothetical protein